MILSKQLKLAVFFGLAALAVFTSGCATQPSIPATQAPTEQISTNVAAHLQHLALLANLKNYTVKGRLGVVTVKQGFSGNIEWQHQANKDYQTSLDNIDVYSPIGGKLANISKNASGVTMTDQKGNSVKANDAESLTETTLGFRLPLGGLSDWVVGRPTTSKIEASSWDAQGRLTNLKQDGWDISYENYFESHIENNNQNNGIFLPNKIVLKSEKLNLKLIIEKWILN